MMAASPTTPTMPENTSPTDLIWIDSTQLTDDLAPRFRVPVSAASGLAEQLAADETHGGVDAELRVFLDAQLATGDVFVDLAPNAGFAALSAATAPGGVPSIVVDGLSEEDLARLQEAAAESGGWLDGVMDEPLAQTIESRLEPEGRVFVRAQASAFATVWPQLSRLVTAGRLVVFCTHAVPDAAAWTHFSAALAKAGLTPCQLVDRQGDAVLNQLDAASDAAVFALPSALFGEDDAQGDV